MCQGKVGRGGAGAGGGAGGGKDEGRGESVRWEEEAEEKEAEEAGHVVLSLSFLSPISLYFVRTVCEYG